MSERLDVYIVTNCGVKSRERAKQLIKNGFVSVNGKVCVKPSILVDENDVVECRPDDMKFVGRGGLKLEHACDVFGLDLTGKVCADIGASTGGLLSVCLNMAQNLSMRWTWVTDSLMKVCAMTAG